MKMMPLEDRFDEKFVAIGSGDCWMWTANTRSGYGQIKGYCHKMKKYRPLCAHRVSWELYNGKISGDMNVLHRCDNPLCVNPDHLFLGTHLDNARDRVEKCREARGERHGRSKLTDDEVDDIRLLYDSMTKKEIGSIFNVSERHVFYIGCGKSRGKRS